MFGGYGWSVANAHSYFPKGLLIEHDVSNPMALFFSYLFWYWNVQDLAPCHLNILLWVEHLGTVFGFEELVERKYVCVSKCMSHESLRQVSHSSF